MLSPLALAYSTGALLRWLRIRLTGSTGNPDALASSCMLAMSLRQASRKKNWLQIASLRIASRMFSVEMALFCSASV